MVAYLERIQAVAHGMPVESLADMCMGLLSSKKLLENPSSSIFSGFDEAIKSARPIIARSLCAYTYPRIFDIASIINAAIGIVHLSVGFTQRFRTLETPADAPAKWNDIALNIHKGFAHLLAASYDFGIGYLLTRQYFDLASVVAFAILPALALQWHQYVFRKPEEAPVTEPLSPLSESEKESAKVIPTYLATTCLIYILAKKITLELIPSQEQAPPENFLAKMGRSLSRLSTLGSEPSLPNYGL